MNDPSVWDRFMPALQQAGGTLGQAGGQAFEGFVNLPGIKQGLGFIEGVSQKAVNPFVSQIIAGSPIQGITKDPERRWEAFKTPDGGISWSAVAQANPFSLLARGIGGVARENIPSLQNFRLAPQNTIKAQRLRDEEARRESELGRQLTGRELRMMEQEMYALPKHVRGALQEAPFLAIPPTAAIRASSAAARTGTAISKLGKAAPVAKVGLKGAEAGLYPFQVLEKGAEKALKLPIKGTAKGLGFVGAKTGVTPAAVAAFRAGARKVGREARAAEIIEGSSGKYQPGQWQWDTEAARVKNQTEEFHEIMRQNEDVYTDYNTELIRGHIDKYGLPKDDVKVFKPGAIVTPDAKAKAMKAGQRAKQTWTSDDYDRVVRLERAKQRFIDPKTNKLKFVPYEETLTDPDVAMKVGGAMERGILRRSGMDIPDEPRNLYWGSEPLFVDPDTKQLRLNEFEALPDLKNASEVRREANNIFAESPEMLVDEAFASSDARFYGKEGAKWFKDEFYTLQNPREADMGYRVYKSVRDGFGNNVETPFNSGIDAIRNAIKGGAIRNTANKMVGKTASEKIDNAVKSVTKKFPVHSSADGFVTNVMKWWDGQFGTRILQDYLAQARRTRPGHPSSPSAFGLTDLAKKVVSFGDILPRVTGVGALRGGNRWLNFHIHELQPLLQTGIATDVIEKRLFAKVWLKHYSVRDATTIDDSFFPKYFDKSKNLKIDDDVAYIRIGEKVKGQTQTEADLSMLKNWDDDDWWLQQTNPTTGNLYTQAQVDAMKEGVEKVSALYQGERLRLLNNEIISPAEYELFSRNYKHWAPTRYIENRLSDDFLEIKDVAKKHMGKKSSLGTIERNVYNLVEKERSGKGVLPMIDEVLGQELIKNEINVGMNQLYRKFMRSGIPEELNLKDVTDGFYKIDPDGAQVRKTNTKGKATKALYDSDKKSGYIQFMKDGRRVVFGDANGKAIPKVLWDSMMGPGGMGSRSDWELDQIVKSANGFFRSVYTSQNPVFAVKNGIIDSLTIQLRAGVGMHKSAAAIIKSVYNSAAKVEDRLATSMKESGGLGGVFYQNQIAKNVQNEISKNAQEGAIYITGNMDNKQISKILNDSVWSKLGKVVPAFGQAIEQAPRLAVAKKSLVKQIGQKEYDRIFKELSLEEFNREMREGWRRVYDVNGNRISSDMMDSAAKGFAESVEFQRAASNGIEASLDFARGGNQIRKWNEYFLFLNASMEAVKMPFRSLGVNLFPVIKPRVRGALGEPGRKGGEDIYQWGSTTEQMDHYINEATRILSLGALGKRTTGLSGRVFDEVSGGPKAAALRMGAALSTYMLIQNQWNKQFEFNGTPLYYDIPSYIRYNSLIFMLPPDKDENGDVIIDPATGRPKPNYIVAPHKLREWNMLFQTATFIDEATDEDVPMDKAKFFSELGRSTSPLDVDNIIPLPEIANVALEELTGRDRYFDRDIVDPDLQELPPEEQYSKYTSKTARNLAGAIDDVLPDGLPVPEFFEELVTSPQRLEHLYENIFGTIGRESLSMTDKGIDVFRHLRGIEPRPMQQHVKEFRQNMTPTERKEFIASLSEEDYAEFRKEMKEAESTTPLYDALKRSYYPQRGGGLRELARSETQKGFPDIDQDATYKAGKQAAKDRQAIKFKQDKDDDELSLFVSKGRGNGMTPKEWIESRSANWALYRHDIDRLSEEYPGSIYAQPKEAREAYYQSINTIAGNVADMRDAADVALAGYYAIEPPSDDPTNVEWGKYFTALDEYVDALRVSSEAKGDEVYTNFMRRREANDSDTVKSYYQARRLMSTYWNVGRDVMELYPGLQQGADRFQSMWDEYLNADSITKSRLRETNRYIKTMVNRRNVMRRNMIIQDALANDGKAILETTLIFWHGEDYYRSPITREGRAYYSKMYE